MATRLISAARTDVGLKRNHNEDNYILVPSQGLYVVADGMGGHASGKIASTMCVQHVTQFICETAKQPNFELPYPPDPSLSYEANVVSSAVQFANERVFIQSCKDRSMEGMGTTVTVIHSVSHGLVLAYVGDSRIYRIRNKTISQLTRDHSLLNHLLEKGEIHPDEISHFANKNVILRAIGLKDNVDVDVQEVPREQGDIYLMCSDGLSDLVPDEQILNAILTAPNLNEACDKLIALALKAGGKDNITVVCICIETEDSYSVTPRQMSHAQTQGQAGQGPNLHPIRTQPDPPSIRQAIPGQAPHGMNAAAIAPPNSLSQRSNMPPAPPAMTETLIAQNAREHSVREAVKSTVRGTEDSMPRPIRGSARAMPTPPTIGKIQSNILEPVKKELQSIVHDDEDDDETLIRMRPKFLQELSKDLQEDDAQPTTSDGHMPNAASRATPASLSPQTNKALGPKPALSSPHTTTTAANAAQTHGENTDISSAPQRGDSVPPIPTPSQSNEGPAAPRRISRISKKSAQEPNEQDLPEIPSAELLLTEAPMAIEENHESHEDEHDQIDDERTILELPIIDDDFLSALEKQESKQTIPSPDSARSNHIPPLTGPSHTPTPSQGSKPRQSFPPIKGPKTAGKAKQTNKAEEQNIKINAPSTASYVPPKQALKPPIFDYDDDEDSIEIDESLLTGIQQGEVTQLSPRPTKKS